MTHHGEESRTIEGPPPEPDLPIREARRDQWRHLADLLRRPELLHELPDDTGPDVSGADGLSRRSFLRLAGASAGLAGLSACTRAPDKEILPYSRQPPEVTPGVPNFYATTMVRDGYGTGLLVESHEGHPTKIEGNPRHPASLGAAGVFEQALVLSLYDPSRPHNVWHNGAPARWTTFASTHADVGFAARGRGVHVLLEPTSSPARIDLIERLRARLPEVTIHFFAPLARDRAWQGARLALGRTLETRVDLSRASVIVSLDDDFLTAGPARQRLARQFADGRRLTGAADPMNRLYVAEPSLSVAGAVADHRVGTRSGELAGLAAALAVRVLTADSGAPAGVVRALRDRAAGVEHTSLIEVAARDLLAHRGEGVVLVGDGQPPEVHAIAHAMNRALGNVGATIAYADSPIFEAGAPSHDLGALVRELDRGTVDTLFILGGNPAYDAFADFDFGNLVRKAPEIAYLGPYANETARVANWFLPEAHALESWGDARAYDGTLSILQPLLAPMFDAHTVDEALAALLGAGSAAPDAHTLVQAHWRTRHEPDRFEEIWRRTVRQGLVEHSSSPLLDTSLVWSSIEDAIMRWPRPATTGLELRFEADRRVYDGRFANNAWLLELPDPVTQLTWDNAALMSGKTMARLGLADEDVVRLEYDGRYLEVPAFEARGHADECVTLTLGYGRSGAEALAEGVGSNAYRLRTSAAPYGSAGLALVAMGRTAPLAPAQLEFDLHGREEGILVQRSLTECRKNPGPSLTKDDDLATLYGWKLGGARQWGMVVDLNACTGCSACVVACQAENNVPVVGKDGVRKGRRMHWLRVDRYVAKDAVRVLPQPMLCQHCEKAPCEYVCPVNATTHSSDGLNQMAYNRCVGTRFCSNNCPYKVRRFNWFNYNADVTPVERLVMNPDVTVRARGVMEKCSYCVQRIREAEIRAGVDGREVRDGEVRTACQQACPAGAIVFGNLADPSSEVARLRANPRQFGVLAELGTVPRTRYLANVRNGNPEFG